MSNIVYLSHGGGPLPLLDHPGHNKLVPFLKQLPLQIEKPTAILVISAHWEEQKATLLGAPNPSLLYDYYGFAQEAYSIQYPAPGHPELVQKIKNLLHAKGIDCAIDHERGFDHGVFIPLKLMYPLADIPVVQMSLLSNLNPKCHIELGRSLQGLLSDNILIIGSGFSFHNMKSFSFHGDNPRDDSNDEFQDWLKEVCTQEFSQAQREENLIHWKKAPYAKYCHPREEHLLPLHVCLGLSSSPAQLVFDDYILGKRALGFLW